MEETMDSKTYHKLVRDKIPDIIAKTGKTADIRILSNGAYARELGMKLLEEVREYLASDDAGELADVLEIVYAIADLKGIGPEGIEELRVRKRERNGGFEKKIFLESVISG
jgi:predicted house-cleaning noncanonical NTP pyrophosphatase (MazG superfamily)